MGNGARIVTSCRAELRLQQARDWLAERGSGEQVLVVSSNNDAATALCVEALEGRPAIFGWSRLSLGRLAVELAGSELARRRLQAAGGITAEAVMARTVHVLATAEGLGRFTPVVHTPGLARALVNTAGELLSAGLAAGDVTSVDSDLARIMAAYQEQLSDSGLVDRPGLLRMAAESARSGEHQLLGVPVLLLDLPVTTTITSDLVAAIAARAPALLATVPAGDKRSLQTLQRALDGAGETLDDGAPASSLESLQLRLFQADGRGAARTQAFDRVPADGSVEVVSAPDMSGECMEIMRHLSRRAEEGIPFDRMAVLLRSPEEYRPYLEEAFARSGIPAHIQRGAVRPDPAGRAFLALLRCAHEGLSVLRFAEYLSLAQVPRPDADGAPPEAGERWAAPDEELIPERVAEHQQRLGPPPDEAEHLEVPDPDLDNDPAPGGSLRVPRRWERLLVDAAVIGGYERWKRRLDGLAAELHLDLQGLEDEEGPAAAAIRRDLTDLEHLQAYALPLVEELDRLPGGDDDADWGAWLDSLGTLAARALRDPQRVLAVLAVLEPLRSVGPVGLGEVVRVLEHHLLELRVAPSGRRWGKVWVGPLDAVAGASFAVVLIPGLSERLFPRPIGEDPVLLDSRRRHLSDDLVTNQERISEERLALRLGVGAASRRVVLSWPRLDLDQGRPRVPSFYALEALRAAEGRLPGHEELARRADVTLARLGWPAPLSSEEAVDEAEYDLAQLHHWLSRPTEQARGGTHYLVSANDHLARALRRRWRRWSRGWSVSDGLVKPGATAAAALAEHAPAARSFSPTALQHLAICPYRFYLYAVLRLTPRDEVQAIDEMDALQRGSLVHEVQYELLTRLRGLELLPVTAARLVTAQEHLDRVLEEVADRYHEQLAPAIERVWQVGVAAIRADLREWLRRAAEDTSGFVPWRFELSFGLQQRRLADTSSQADPASLDCGIRLRGSVDLVERRQDGTLRVTDHKTGKARVRRDAVIAGGEALQPVLYALALEKLHPDTRVAAGRLYYCTLAGGFEDRVVPLDRTARRSAEQVARVASAAIDDGFLPAAPREDGCRYCDYQVLCGPNEERRTRIKPTSDLRSLSELRGLP